MTVATTAAMLAAVSIALLSLTAAAPASAEPESSSFDLRLAPAATAYFDHGNVGIGPSGEAQLSFFASPRVQLGVGVLAYAPVQVQESSPKSALVALLGVEGVLRIDDCERAEGARFEACPFFEVDPVLAAGLSANHEGGGALFVNVRGGAELVWDRAAGIAPFLGVSLGGLVALSGGLALVLRGG